jgi:hypothetical protein
VDIVKKFCITKNIILAFIVFISITLKLSTLENATSLMGDNVLIREDKATENISKQKAQNKKILCYERKKAITW